MMGREAELIEVSDRVYHENGFTSTPCYSNSIGKLIVGKTPKHAWLAHPKLNPDFDCADNTKFALGTVAHAALLQGIDVCEPLDFADWRTGAAKEARDAAYLAGKIPMLQKQFEEVTAMVSAAMYQIEHCKDLGIQLSDGKAEQTIIVSRGDLKIKTRLDWLANDRSLILDYKTTDVASPGQFMKAITGMGTDMQAALYTEAVKLLAPGSDPRFVLAVQETEAPYAMYFVGIEGQLLAHGQQRTERAIQIWQQCLASNQWPMYPNNIMWAELPPWVEGEYVMKEAALVDAGVWKKFRPEEFLFGRVK